jgi:hypothetical protein
MYLYLAESTVQVYVPYVYPCTFMYTQRTECICMVCAQCPRPVEYLLYMCGVPLYERFEGHQALRISPQVPPPSRPLLLLLLLLLGHGPRVSWSWKSKQPDTYTHTLYTYLPNTILPSVRPSVRRLPQI